MASKPVSVISVAKYILHQQGEMSAMKLQKLCYYSQAWHMAWEDKALFDEDFQAWANGPVCRPLYDKHQGEFILKKDFFDTEQTEELKEDQKESINMVLEFYGSKSPQWLSEQTHIEAPWRDARKDVPDMERSDNLIRKSSIAEYYSAL